MHTVVNHDNSNKSIIITCIAKYENSNDNDSSKLV
jgi:hypothetical protein